MKLLSPSFKEIIFSSFPIFTLTESPVLLIFVICLSTLFPASSKNSILSPTTTFLGIGILTSLLGIGISTSFLGTPDFICFFILSNSKFIFLNMYLHLFQL
jgi:hypothetical protein